MKPPSELETDRLQYLIDADSERFVLGAVMVDETCFRRIAPYLTEHDFALRKHQLIWRAMVHLSERNEPIDRVILFNHLRDNRDADEVGGLSGLADLDSGMPKLTHPESYAKIVRRKSQERQIFRVFGNISREAALGIEKPGELLHRARRAIEEIRLLDASFAPENAGDLIANYPGGPAQFFTVSRAAVSYPFEGVQRKTGGLRPGEVTLLAARPSIGKTAFALNVNLHAARQGKRVGFFSREMSKEELCKRLLSYITQTNLFDIMRGQLTMTERVQMEHAARELQDIPLFLDDLSRTVAQIRRQSEAGKYELVTIDYLGLLTAPGRHENRNAEVSTISREVKLMALELGIPVLALHQLSRQTEARADKRPEMPDLRDSGSLEQDADVVMFLYREGYYKRNDPSLQYAAELLIRKQRNGPTGDVPLEFFAPFVAFADPSSRGQGNGDGSH